MHAPFRCKTLWPATNEKQLTTIPQLLMIHLHMKKMMLSIQQLLQVSNPQRGGKSVNIYRLSYDMFRNGPKNVVQITIVSIPHWTVSRDCALHCINKQQGDSAANQCIIHMYVNNYTIIWYVVTSFRLWMLKEKRL